LTSLIFELKVSFVPERVFGHADGLFTAIQKGHPRPRVASVGQLVPIPELPGLPFGRIQAAVFQELVMMSKPMHVAALRENDHRQHRAHAGEGAELPEVRPIIKNRLGPGLEEELPELPSWS